MISPYKNFLSHDLNGESPLLTLSRDSLVRYQYSKDKIEEERIRNSAINDSKDKIEAVLNTDAAEALMTFVMESKMDSA